MSKVVASYFYCAAQREPIARIDRIEPGFDGASKSFLPYLWNPSKGRYSEKSGLNGTNLPLYHLDEVRAAILARQTIYLVEGEGKCDRLCAALQEGGSQAAVTTIFGGANAPLREDHVAAFNGALEVYVLADSDHPGCSAASERAQRIVEAYLRCEVRVVDLFPDRSDGSDVADFFSEGGSLQELYDVLNGAPRIELSPSALLPDVPSAAPGIITRQLSHIEPRQIEWRWYQHIPAGTFGLLAGPPGVGKSILIAVIGGADSMGRALPGDKDKRFEGQDVLLLSFEDDAAAILRPRFDALEANLDRIHIVEGVLRGDGSKDAFELSDIQLLEEKLDALPEVGLVVIDPISSKLGHVDTWRSPQVRAVLDPFLEKCAARGITVLAVAHTTKRDAGPATFKIEGSLGAFVGRARFVLGAGKTNDGRYGIAVLKSNYGPTDSVPVVEYEIDAAGEFHWLGETNEIEPAALFGTSPLSDDERSELEDAKDSICGALAAGRITATDLAKRVKADGVADVTFRRARSEMRRSGGIKRSGGGVAGPVMWELADIESQDHPQNLIRKHETECGPMRQSADETELLEVFEA